MSHFAKLWKLEHFMLDEKHLAILCDMVRYDIICCILECRMLLYITRDGGLHLKPALVQDTDYMVEKTSQLAPYVGPFEAYLTPQ